MDNQNKVSSVSVVKNKLRGQEAASLYIPPPLRVKAKSTPASKESVPPPRTSMRDMLLKELGVENSSNKSKKCENSYMLFDIDGPKSSASASNTARRAPSKTMGVGHQNGDHRASEPLSQKSSQQRIKKCDNSYLLFSGKSDDDECSGGAYSKKCIKGSKPSPRLQDSQRKATSTHYVPSLDQAEVGDSTKSPEFKKGPLVDELSCQLGISKISSPPGLLVDRPKELSDLILNKSCQSSQKKCDNSILLFDEDNASSSSLVKHTSKTENETAKYSSLSNGTVEDGQDGLSQTPSRKRPPSNEISQANLK